MTLKDHQYSNSRFSSSNGPWHPKWGWGVPADFDFDAELKKAMAGPKQPGFGSLVSGKEIRERTLALPPEMICGLLAQGEKGELAGGSKAYKTWTLIHQALCIAAGQPWWGFNCLKNNVVFLNLEIPQPFFENRMRTVAKHLGIDIPDNLFVWHLRNAKLGDLVRWGRFLDELRQKCADIPTPFLTSDPIYKLLGGRNENSAGDVATLLEQLDDMVTATNGANFFGHHFSKGCAAEKDVIDRAAGSGVFQRDPDSILIMTAHQKEDAFTVDSFVRNHERFKSFVVEWHYPIFRRVDSLDPAELKQPKKKRSLFKPQILIELLGNEALNTKSLFERFKDETGRKDSTFYSLLKEAEELKLIVKDNISRTWEAI